MPRITRWIPNGTATMPTGIDSRNFRKYFSGLDDFDKLKTAPKGYAKDHPMIDLLRHRSFVVSYAFSDAEVNHKMFVKNVAAVCRAIKPFNDFLKTAVDE